MFQTVYLGKLLGIKVYIHWTFWFLAMYVFLSNLSLGLGNSLYALLFVFSIFGCVFLHEMGHAIAGMRFGIPTVDITLYPIGGMARMGEFSRSPVAEFVVALAGPMVNLGIALVLMLVGLSVQDSFDSVSSNGLLADFWMQLLVANIVLALFNLLPSFPMDGGRVLRSLLAMVMPYSSATTITARVGQVMAVMMLMASFRYGISLALIAIFVFMVCSGELLKERLVRVARQMENDLGAAQAMHEPSYADDDIVDAVDVRRVP